MQSIAAEIKIYDNKPFIDLFELSPNQQIHCSSYCNNNNNNYYYYYYYYYYY